MPVLGLGTLNNRGADATALVEAALAAGYRHLDTAEFYGNEDGVGAGIARSSVSRSDVWVTTKILHPLAPRPESVRSAAQASLGRLGLDWVDALLIHWPTPHAALEEALEVFCELRDEGAVRHIGVSNFPTGLLRQAKTLEGDIALDQIEVHPFLDQAPILQAARELDVFVVAHSPLARGRVADDPVLRQVGEEAGATAAQVALAWLRQRGIGAIPGGSPHRIDELSENLASLELSLTDAQMSQISRLAQGLRIVDGDHAPRWDE